MDISVIRHIFVMVSIQHILRHKACLRQCAHNCKLANGITALPVYWYAIGHRAQMIDTVKN